jgi:hypothetical protein
LSDARGCDRRLLRRGRPIDGGNGCRSAADCRIG